MTKPYAKYSLNPYVRSIGRNIVRRLISNVAIPLPLLDMPYKDFDMMRKRIIKLAGNRKNHYHISDMSNVHYDLFKYSAIIADAISGLNDNVSRAFTVRGSNDACRDVKRDVIRIFEAYEKADFIKFVDDLEEHRLILEGKSAVRRKRRSGLSKWCHRVSAPVAIVCTVIASILKLIFWTGLIKGSWFVIATVSRHTWIFLVYMWTVIKHLKHGTCPYMMFTNQGDERADEPRR